MSIDWAALPIAWLAGVLGIVSPCVWPLVPIVMASAVERSRFGPLMLALGLSLAFALSGTFLTFALIALGLNPDAYRPIAAIVLVLVGLVLVIKPLGLCLNNALSRFSARFNGLQVSSERFGQFGVGMLLGLVWLPCVGPTLGAAIALASVGQDFAQAFVVMLAFGLGTSMALLVAGLASARVLSAWRPGILNNAVRVKTALGLVLLVLGLIVLTGWDKQLEAWVLPFLPDMAFSM